MAGTKEALSRLIETIVSNRRIPYMEACIMACEKADIDPTEVKRFLSTSIKDKIEAEAMDLHFLPKGGTLPID